MTETVLITGANGEIGHGLIPELAKTNKYNIIALDVKDLDPELKSFAHEVIAADILDPKIIGGIFNNHKITTVFHLAAVLSSAGERNPELAQSVNVDGSFKLISATNNFAQKLNTQVKFIFPSSIAVYGLPTLEDKTKAGRLKETDFNNPITIYGINKLYCELVGSYFSDNYKLLDLKLQRLLDFRAVRFPGIISAITEPSGGTSDYAPEMIHRAARGEGYESFVRADTQIPFMVMPDAVKALIQLNEAPKDKLSQKVYNVTAFASSVEQIAETVNGVFPDSSISYSPDPARQKIVDSWPGDLDDTKARNDWGWNPEYDLDKAFKNYLIPEIQNNKKN